MVSVETLVLVHRAPRILLAMKKRRFGKGHYNGFGGKVEGGESILECAIRETKEEGGIGILDPVYIGKILFKFLDSDEQDHEVYFFKVTKYSGEPVETDEMKPIWFDQRVIPYDEMWADDRYWMPLFLRNKKFVGEFHFAKDGSVAYYKLNEVGMLDDDTNT